jgi:hypothetical protein
MRYALHMKEIPFIKPEQAATAREMEQRLLSIREDSGVLFVGVSVKPMVAGEGPIYHVWIGCSRNADERTMGPLVHGLFNDEIMEGRRIEVEAHRGLLRS